MKDREDYKRGKDCKRGKTYKRGKLSREGEIRSSEILLLCSGEDEPLGETRRVIKKEDPRSGERSELPHVIRGS